MSDSNLSSVEALMADFDHAMLITRSIDGMLRARPMAIANQGAEGTLYFVSRSDDEKLAEVLDSPDVAVTMQGDGKYVSLSGKARLITNQLVAEEMWSAAMRIWFPDGPDDSRITTIIVEPEYAEYWDRSGLRRLEFLWEAGKALIQSESVDDKALGGHGKVKI